MMKTPEEYFKDQEFTVGPDAEKGHFTPAELAFMQKYLGLDQTAALKKLGLEAPAQAEALSRSEPEPDIAMPVPPREESGTQAEQSAPATGAADIPADAGQPVSGSHPAIEREPDLADQLRLAPELQMVSFFMGEQEFCLPIMTVQEVIRFQQPTRLPAAPSFIAGIINLRGRVTPLVRLRELLGIEQHGDAEDKFIIVCRRHGLQLGMMIESVHTMYRVPQSSIDWALESNLGCSVEFVSGLMKSGEKLISIVSVDHIVDSVLQV